MDEHNNTTANHELPEGYQPGSDADIHILSIVFVGVIGTVLGGIWANDSWGRFWGWDPKENGALMIVLWSLVILHARLGGYIKDWGLHLCAIFGAVIVAFSWWHVNFLNVGLHNYGFAADKKFWLVIFYGIMGVFIVWGGIACLLERIAKNQAKLAADQEKAADEVPVPPQTTF